MIVYNYLIVGALAFALVLLSKSHRAMNAFTVLHAFAYLGLGAFALAGVGGTPLPFQSLTAGNSYFYLDSLSLYEALVASLLFCFASVYANGYVESLMEARELHRKNLKIFYLAFSLLLTVTTLAFFSDSLALFWIFAELTTVFSAALVAILSARENIDAALKYIFIASGAMLFAFIGLIFLFKLSEEVPGCGGGTLNWTLLMANASSFSPKMLTASFVFIFIGFAAKSGIVPFHTWLPDAHSKAPSAVSAILSGVLLNVGTYGILRIYALVRQTEAAPLVSNFLIAFGLLTVAVAVLNMLRQKNLKMLIAFSSVEHMGMILLGIGAGSPLALFWTLYYVLAHSLTKASLFFSAGILHRQYESNLAGDMRDVLKLQPLAGWGFIVGSLAIVGLPPFPIFSAKLSILLEAARLPYGGALVLFVLLLLVLASAAFASFLLEAFTRRSAGLSDGLSDGHSDESLEKQLKPYHVRLGMKAPIALMLCLVLVLGLFCPDFLENLLNGIVQELGYV